MHKAKGYMFFEVVIYVLIAVSIIGIAVPMYEKYINNYRPIEPVVSKYEPPSINAEYTIFRMGHNAIYKTHDDASHVTCWSFSNGGISCILDKDIDTVK